MTQQDYNQILHIDTFLDLKDILLLDKTLNNTLVISNLPYSRFRIIMSNYMALNGLHYPNHNMADECDYYTLYKLNNRGNAYKIIKSCSKQEEDGFRISKHLCSCSNEGRKRYKLNGHDKCYYCLRIERDYTTKIYDELQPIINQTR